jgi:hypothetical protein
MDLMNRKEKQEFKQYRLSGDRKTGETVEIEGVPGHKLGDVQLVDRIMRKLLTTYPGYRWQVGIHDDDTGGVAYIINKDINSELWSNMQYGYVLKLRRIYTDPNLTCVMRAAGNILERARVERGRRRFNQKITHVDGVKPQHQPGRIVLNR